MITAQLDIAGHRFTVRSPQPVSRRLLCISIVSMEGIFGFIVIVRVLL